MTSEVLILSRYARNGASSRLRFMQYLPWLERSGLTARVSNLFDAAYLEARYAGRGTMRRLPAYLIDRCHVLHRARNAGLIWLEGEALPWLPWGIERQLLPRHVPLVADYDDALFHRYDRHRNPAVRRLLGRKIDRVMARADLVTAGNSYLAARARAAGARRVEIVPTVVDADAYGVTPLPACDGHPRIGWIGTPGTWTQYMSPMLPMLRDLARSHGAVIRNVGGGGISADPLLETLPWSEDSESRMIQGMDIGLMPLDDSLWSRGKCGYKLIQYMACGVPVIASPVGVNAGIVEHGVTGFLARTEDEWRRALEHLLADPDLRRRMGAAGRRRMEAHYSLQAWAPRVVDLLRDQFRP